MREENTYDSNCDSNQNGDQNFQQYRANYSDWNHTFNNGPSYSSSGNQFQNEWTKNYDDSMFPACESNPCTCKSTTQLVLGKTLEKSIKSNNSTT